MSDHNSRMSDFLSWDWVRMNVLAWRALAFMHISTEYRETDSDGCRRGSSLWAAAGTERVGLAWEWLESEPGSGRFVASMPDLMTNALLIDADGHELVHARSSIEVLNTIAALPWHEQVVRSLACEDGGSQ